jgi:hypothetical protein
MAESYQKMSKIAIGPMRAYLPLLPAPLAGSGFGFSFFGLRTSLVFFCWPFAMMCLLQARAYQ